MLSSLVLNYDISTLFHDHRICWLSNMESIYTTKYIRFEKKQNRKSNSTPAFAATQFTTIKQIPEAFPTWQLINDYGL